MKKIEFESDLKIGKLGEGKFSDWCAAAELTCNRSFEEDRNGWDHLVEFPYIRTALPKDMQQRPIECKVQVKSTQRRDRKWSIKASVLKRLIDYSYPSFILFLEFTNASEPEVENAFLIHIDKQIIEKTLKAIRRNDTSKAPKHLYDLKISISYGKKNQLQKLSGNAFKEAVIKYVPDGDITKYQKIKTKLVGDVGYDESGCYRLQFNVTPDEFQRHILARAIGVGNDQLEVKNTVFFDNRFNLKDGAVELNRSNEARLVIEPNIIDKCKLRFLESEFSPSIDFDGEFITTPSISKDKKSSIFVRTNLFSIELRDWDNEGKFDCGLHFTLDKSVALSCIINFFQLFQADNVGKQLICLLELINENRTLKFIVNMNYDFEDVSQLANSLKIIKDSFNLESSVSATVDEMYIQKDKISALVSAIQNKVTGCRINLREEHPDRPETIKAPMSLGVKIGEKFVGAIIIYHGTKIDGLTYKVEKIELLKPLVFNGEKLPIEKLHEIEKKELEEYEKNNDS